MYTVAGAIIALTCLMLPKCVEPGSVGVGELKLAPVVGLVLGGGPMSSVTF